MKKFYALIMTFLAFSLALQGQAWEVYDAKYLPTASTPSFSSSSANNATYYLLENPEMPGDSILVQETFPETSKTQLWRRNYTTTDLVSVTIVARVKALTTETDRAIEFDLDNNGKRERVFIFSDSRIITHYNKDTADIQGSVLDWHIYRIVKTDDMVKVYVDEDPTPVFENSLNTGGTANYFRFGDGASDRTYGFQLDWVVWDESGAYAPGEGAPLPEELITKVHQWTVYAANELPNDFSSSFVTSNVSGVEPTQNIITDPDDAENNLFEFVSDGASSSYLWRYNFPEQHKKVTLLTRIKGYSTDLDHPIEFDLDFNGYRERFFYRGDNTFRVREANIEGPLPVGVMGWHILRLTMENDSVNVYIDENPVPLVSGKTPTGGGTRTNKYFRFGDGDSNRSYGFHLDWMIWDTTGAFAPDMGNIIPDSLITAITPSDASLTSLTADAGAFSPDFDPEVTEYQLVVPTGTALVTLTATPADPLATVEGDGEIAVPGTTTITVTAQDGFITEYVVNVSTGASTDATLASLTTSVGELDPVFDPGVAAYTLELPAGTATVTLTATPNDENASITGDGEITEFPATATITVTAEDGTTTKDYTVEITVLPSDDATLASLVPSAGELNPAFDPDVTSYDLELPEETTSVTLTATPADDNASVTGDGDFTTFPATATITVTAEDGTTTMVYTVEITVATSVQGLFTGEVQLYPNPASDHVNIILEKGSVVTLYSALGIELYSANAGTDHLRMGLDNLPAGVYFVRIATNDKVHVRSFLKK